MFAGLVRFTDHRFAPAERERLSAIVSRRHGASRVAVRAAGAALLAAPGLIEDGGILFASESRLDDLEEMAASLGGRGEAACIRHLYETRGDAGIARLLGDFAFVHWDARARTLTLARDCKGRRPLFYHTGKGIVAFASHLGDLLALPEVPRELDERMLANFLALNHRETDKTFYRGILRVPSRSIVRITPGGAERHHYWSPKVDAPPPYTRDEDYIERARELFERAVRRTVKGADRVAVHLSGGLDSSAVAATAAALGTVAVTGYTGLPPADLDRPPREGWYLDERPKVEALARMHPALNATFVTPRGAHSRQSDPARFFADMPLPIRGTCNLGWFAQIDDAIAANGHDRLLAGGAGNMTLSWTGDFHLAELARRGRFLRLLTEARAFARANDRGLLRTLLGRGLMPMLPPALQRQAGRLRGVTPDDVSGFSLLDPAVIADMALPRQWRKDGFDPAYRRRGSSARLRAHQIFDQRQFGRDMAAMRAATSSFDQRDPFRDRELIEFSLSVPDTVFCRGGVRRWFARQVFADRLPPEILTETRSGEQAPNWFESLDARKPLIEEQVERIEASRLASRLIAEWPADARAAHERMAEYRYGLDRAVHLGQFIRWVEGGNG